ncbi:MAG: Gfo/Idh/MocA family oxidoreductase [Pirellulaceae bacterium]
MANKYRVAVIGRTGKGNYGHGLDTAWFDVPQTEIVAVADDDPAGLAAAAKKLKVERAYTDYRKMLDEVKPDIAAVCPRWVDQHRDMTVAAAERGIHTYMEKPFCRTPAEADEIIAACQRAKVKVAVAHPTSYSPTLETIRQLIADGAIGEVLELRGRGKEDRRGGGEDLWVLGAHVMDMILALGYEPQWCFAHVTQDGRRLRKEHVAQGAEGLGPLAGDAVHAMYGLRGGVNARFDSVRGMQGAPSRYGLMICGSRGIVELLEGTLPSVRILQDASWSPGRSDSAWKPVSSAGIDKPEPLTDAKYRRRHQLAIEDFLASIENDREPKCGMHQGREIVEMIAAVFDSQRRGRPVAFPLEVRQNPLTLL